MAEIGIAKAGVRAVTAAKGGEPAVQKTQPSKFDSVRSQLSQNLNLTPVQQMSDQQAANLEMALRKRITETVAQSPSDLFASDMRSTRSKLNRITTVLKKMPAK